MSTSVLLLSGFLLLNCLSVESEHLNFTVLLSASGSSISFYNSNSFKTNLREDHKNSTHLTSNVTVCCLLTNPPPFDLPEPTQPAKFALTD